MIPNVTAYIPIQKEDLLLKYLEQSVPRIELKAPTTIPHIDVFAYRNDIESRLLFLKQDSINIEVAPPILLIGIVSRDGVKALHILDLGNLFVGYHCRLNKLFPSGDDGGFAVKVSPLGGEYSRGAEGQWNADLRKEEMYTTTRS